MPLTPPSVNERESARQAKDRKTASALAEIGITPAEASLFNVLHFGLTVPPSDLCCRAACADYSLGGPITVEENQAALAGCLSKGWLQIVDEVALGRIQDEVLREGLVGPVYGYPSLGGVDFTHAGAEQWFRICDRCWGGRHDASFAFCDVVRIKTSH